MNTPRKKKKARGMTVKAKKKTAVARAVVRRVEKGRVTINKRDLATLEPETLRMLVQEPLELAPETASKAYIRVTVRGGGFMAQAMAARSAIARALVRMHRSEKLRKRFAAYDRVLVVDDPRRKEPKKPLGTGARKKKQKSKR